MPRSVTRQGLTKCYLDRQSLVKVCAAVAMMPRSVACELLTNARVRWRAGRVPEPRYGLTGLPSLSMHHQGHVSRFGEPLMHDGVLMF